MTRLKAYRTVNQQLLGVLGSQLSSGTLATTEGELGGSVAGFSAKIRRTVTGDCERDDMQRLNAVVEALRNSGQLKSFRPERSREFWDGGPGDWYVYEELLATPVVLSTRRGTSDERTIRVWVGDPYEIEAPTNEFDVVGSFLFLVEDLLGFDWPSPASFVSGISALRLTVEFIAGSDSCSYEDLMEARAEADDFGRFIDADPLDKLRSAGGDVGLPRLIETVYKIKYMTNEQSYIAGERAVRINDILAYPLYIAE